jgi:hypothetical protein
MQPFIDCFSKGDRPSNRQRLRELGDHDFDTGPV